MSTLSREQVDRLSVLLKQGKWSLGNNDEAWAIFEQFPAHDATQRALLRQREEEIAQLKSAVEVIQSSRDILLNTFTLWTVEYQEGKMALRELPDLRAQLAAMTAERDVLWQECEQEHCDILVCTECGRTSKHGRIGVVYESTPNSAEEYDTKCPECGSMSLDEDARSVVNELDTCKAQLAASLARCVELEKVIDRVDKLEASIRDDPSSQSLNVLSNMGIGFVEKAVKWYQQALTPTERPPA